MTFKDYFLTEDIDSRMPHLVQQFGNLPEIQKYAAGWGRPVEWIINVIAKDADPTYPRADYTTWILRLAKKGNISLGGEDFEKVRERLDQFDRLKRVKDFKGFRDINQYETFAYLALTLDRNEGIMSKAAEVRANQTKGTTLEITQDPFSIYRVTTPEACAKLFRHTEWCVKDPKYAEAYLENGPLYYFTKSNEPFALLHFPSGQFLDVYDQAFEDYSVFRPLASWFEKHLQDIDPRHGNWLPIIVGLGLAKHYLHTMEQRVKDEDVYDNVGALYQFCIQTKETSKVLEDYISSDKNSHVGMIARYTAYCKNGNWQEGEQRILSLAKEKFDETTANLQDNIRGIWDATKAVNFLQSYTVAVRKKRWPEAEALIKQYPRLQGATRTYWDYVSNGLQDLKGGKLGQYGLQKIMGQQLPMVF